MESRDADDEEAWLLACAALRLAEGSQGRLSFKVEGTLEADFEQGFDDQRGLPRSGNLADEDGGYAFSRPEQRKVKPKPVWTPEGTTEKPQTHCASAASSLDRARDALQEIEDIFPLNGGRARRRRWRQNDAEPKPPTLYTTHLSDSLTRRAVRYDRSLHQPCILASRDSRRGHIVTGTY